MILTFDYGANQVDFKVEKDYRIKDVLRILNEDTELKSDLEKLHYIGSKRRNQKVNILYTFEEAELFNGDTLVIGK